jgi:hypothetical protein
MIIRFLITTVLLGAAADLAQADSTLPTQQSSSCPPIYSNTAVVHTHFADLEEIYDDLHTAATDEGPLCGFDLWFRNSSPTAIIRAEVSFYANGPGDFAPMDRIAGPYSVWIPQDHSGPIYVETSSGRVQRNMWVGVRFPVLPTDGAGFVGLTMGPAEMGSSHDLLYSKAVDRYLDMASLNADIYVTVYSSAPRSVEDSTWGRVKSTFR